MKTTLILTCAGKGTRAGFGKNKLLVKTNGITLLERTLSAFTKTDLIKQYIITASEEDFDEIKTLAPFAIVVKGGATRTESVKNALAQAEGDVVLIHDGARPFVLERIIKECISAAVKFGGAITAVPSRDTVAKGGECATEYLGKSGLYSVQTPQSFKTKLIKKAYALAGDTVFNDDGEVYKEYIAPPHIVNGDLKNVKITYKEDFDLISSYGGFKVGTGFDCHKLVEGRKLILGGVEIPHDKGLLGHSDADVLTHAIMDALLSSLSLRDIGYHFPDTNPIYKGANSMELLEKVLQMVFERGYKVNNVSAVIMAEKPKLLKFIPAITENLAAALNVEKSAVGITATTLEGLGFVGREEGICVHSTVSIIKE